MGALLAFEVARLASARQIPPEYLFVAGAKAPHLRTLPRRTYDLPEAEFLQEIHKLNGMPREVLENEELLSLVVPILRADFQAVDTYTFLSGEPPLTCPIAAFGGLEDPLVPEQDLRAWRQHTTREFSSLLLPGDHFFVNTAYLQLTAEIARLFQQNRP